MEFIVPAYTAARARRALLAGLITLLALAGLGVGHRAAAAGRVGAPRMKILVLPFDLFDFSLDRRARTVVPLHRWTGELSSTISADLRHDTRLNVLAPHEARRALRAVRANYAHPTTCRPCVLAVARQLGADLVVIGQVHKLSNLITYFDIQLDEVRTGHVLHVIDMRADGADSGTMWRRIAQNIARRVQSAADHAH